MGRGTQLSEREQGLIQGLRENGMSNRAIADRIGRSSRAVDRFLLIHFFCTYFYFTLFNIYE